MHHCVLIQLFIQVQNPCLFSVMLDHPLSNQYYQPSEAPSCFHGPPSYPRRATRTGPHVHGKRRCRHRGIFLVFLSLSSSFQVRSIDTTVQYSSALRQLCRFWWVSKPYCRKTDIKPAFRSPHHDAYVILHKAQARKERKHLYMF